MGPFYRDIFAEKWLELEALGKGYLFPVDYIHEKVTSIKQMLPIFTYLSNYDTGQLYRYPNCSQGLFECNEFLEYLNIGKSTDFSIRSYDIVSNSFETFRTFLLSKPERLIWRHGKPYKYPDKGGIVFGSGDQTVPDHSSRWADKTIVTNSKHGEIPYHAQSEISKILIGKEITRFGRTKPVNAVLFIGIKSPADIILTTPDGKKHGAGFGDDGNAFYSGQVDPEFITIPNPPEGEYRLQVIGTDEGHFEVEASLLADNQEQTQTFEGQITPGEKYEFGLNYVASLNQPLKLEKKDTMSPTTKFIITGQKKGSHEYYPGAYGILEAKDEESEIQVTEYSMDLGQTWIQYSGRVAFTEPQEYELLYRSQDSAENMEYAKYSRIVIASRPQTPETTVTSTPQLSSSPPAGEDRGEGDEGFATTTEEIIGRIPPETATSGKVLGAITGDYSASSSGLSRGSRLLFWILIPVAMILGAYLLIRKKGKT